MRSAFSFSKRPLFAGFALIAALPMLVMTGCYIDHSDSLSVVVMPESQGAAWQSSRIQMQDNPRVELKADTKYVVGVDVHCLRESEVDSFSCEATLVGNEIHVDIDLKTRDTTDDCPEGFRRLCPVAPGPLPAGQYQAHALDRQVSFQVPSVVPGSSLFLPPKVNTP